MNQPPPHGWHQQPPPGWPQPPKKSKAPLIVAIIAGAALAKARTTNPNGLGDQAAAVVVDSASSFMDISIIVHKGDDLVDVQYEGWDAGLFGNTRPDLAEFEAAAKGLAEEMVAKL